MTCHHIIIHRLSHVYRLTEGEIMDHLEEQEASPDEDMNHDEGIDGVTEVLSLAG